MFKNNRDTITIQGEDGYSFVAVINSHEDDNASFVDDPVMHIQDNGSFPEKYLNECDAISAFDNGDWEYITICVDKYDADGKQVWVEDILYHTDNSDEGQLIGLAHSLIKDDTHYGAISTC